jgi:hypothetical protein
MSVQPARALEDRSLGTSVQDEVKMSRPSASESKKLQPLQSTRSSGRCFCSQTEKRKKCEGSQVWRCAPKVASRATLAQPSPAAQQMNATCKADDPLRAILIVCVLNGRRGTAPFPRHLLAPDGICSPMSMGACTVGRGRERLVDRLGAHPSSRVVGKITTGDRGPVQISRCERRLSFAGLWVSPFRSIVDYRPRLRLVFGSGRRERRCFRGQIGRVESYKDGP